MKPILRNSHKIMVSWRGDATVQYCPLQSMSRVDDPAFHVYDSACVPQSLICKVDRKVEPHHTPGETTTVWMASKQLGCHNILFGSSGERGAAAAHPEEKKYSKLDPIALPLQYMVWRRQRCPCSLIGRFAWFLLYERSVEIV